MAQGLIVYSTSGALQLSDSGTYYKRYTSGSVTADTSQTPHFIDIPFETVRDGQRILFIRSNSTEFFGSATAFSLAPYGGTTFTRVYGVPSGSIDYLIASCSDGWSSPSGYGLSLYTPSGTVAFNSQDGVVVITTTATVTVSPTDSTVRSVAYSVSPYSAVPYMLASGNEDLQILRVGSTLYWVTLRWRFNGTNIDYYPQVIDTYPAYSGTESLPSTFSKTFIVGVAP